VLSDPYVYAQPHHEASAVVEIITNETARHLDLLAKQSTKMHNAIYQNHLALDYLLASEGKVCKKFNLNNCCLQINDSKKKVIKEITNKIRKLAYVPVQTWSGWDPNDLFRGWFSAVDGFKTMIGAMGLILETCLILPCLVPLVLQSIKTTIKVVI
jgi:hypothetical protein